MGEAWLVSDVLDGGGDAARIAPDEVAGELERIRRALSAVAADLRESARRVSEELDPDVAEIFGAHRMMLDGLLASHEFEKEVEGALLPAADAVRVVFRRWEARFASLADETFRQRADDVVDLARRVLRRLDPAAGPGLAALPPGSVLVAQRLLPSDVVALSNREVAAILVESLGQGSHAAILAREKAIPVVAQLPGLLEGVRRGDALLVDAFRGVAIVSPGPETRRDFERRLEQSRANLFRCKGECHKPAITRDGQRVRVEANLAAGEEAELLLENGADGVGLFRIEQLYLARELPPSEDELLEELARIVAPLREKPVTIRLLDIGGDKTIPSVRLPREPNPALGKRGVRLLLDHPRLLGAQLRALLRLSATQPIRVLVPMITLERDIARVREQLAAAAREVGIRELPPLGAMIETPAAALCVAQIGAHADFLCVGTNDLAQYTLAAGRDDETVSQYYADDHPALFRLLGLLRADAPGKPVTLCGELAGREEAIPRLLGMGFRGLSIAPRLVPTTKELIRSTTLSG
jgi:phosphoenolpyruvate-protein phosphotransferase (PTS system enzyme I)